MQTESKRIMAVDYGRKRIGIAISDEQRIAITPLPILYYTQKNFWKDFDSIIEKYQPGEIIIGNPVLADGSEGSLSYEISNFKRRLEKKFPHIKITLFDETYTSQVAVSIMEINRSKKLSPKKNKKKIDSVAAAVLLKDYLNQR
ncbi:MAG: Holliday junction resolvase RuvX [Candidatus Hydrogenedentota bacterium]|nr:MAG: Holliday junction resolvase RuvX [Candidatus Hydrogenedentota bacterium]